MIRRHALLFLAILGVLVAIVAIIHDNQPASTQPPVIQPPHAPYTAYVSGAGLVEASSRNLAIGTPVPGIVKNVDVQVGDHVKPGDILFEIDDRDLQAQLLTATAKVKEAAASLQKPKHRLNNAENLRRRDPGVISAQDLSDLRDEAAQAVAALELAKAQVGQIKVEIDRRIVRAPIAGVILQLRMRPGEYMEGGGTVAPTMLIGDDATLHVRVDIDENEAWRVRPDAEAMAFVRGNPDQKIPLEFEYLEPYVIPKTALTGQGTERTDRRVLQVIYGFTRGDIPVYVGQQLDVYIQASPVSSTRSGTGR
ncbi:MAG: efflux RND transporter periplasmic adaptor subunit [Gammaproteobacteria bacterium]|nr:efflux RND transporter periplasmic adaptor subunit [Gammaproteobacteria bacterium]